MTKTVIASYSDLRFEKEKIKADINYRKTNIKEAFNDMKQELNPFASFSKGAKNLLQPQNSSPLISFGVATAADFLLKKVFLRRAGFLPKLIIPFVVSRAAKYISAPRLNEKIVNRLHHTASSIREVDVADAVSIPAAKLQHKISATTATIGGKIADTLYNTADKVREDGNMNIVPENISAAVSNAGDKVAAGLRNVADKVRGEEEVLFVHQPSKKALRAARKTAKNNKIAAKLRLLANNLRSTNYKPR